MKIKKIVKKIAALGIGASMVGATLMGAMAANLNDYPNMFISDGKFNGVFVVGADAKGEDVVGVTAILASLQNVPVQLMTEAATGTSAADVGAVGYKVLEGSELCDQDLFPNTNLTDCDSGVNDADLPTLLADGVYRDFEGDNDNEQNYKQDIFFVKSGSTTGQFGFFQDDDDAPVAGSYLLIDDSQKTPLYKFKLEFDEDIVYDNSSQSTTKKDLEGTSLNIMGRDYTITDIRTKSGGLLDVVEMVAGDSDVWLSQGQTIKPVIDGEEHAIKLIDVTDDINEDSGSCVLEVDGTQVVVDVDQSIVVGGFRLAAVEGRALHEEAQNVDMCRVVPGAHQLAINDKKRIEINEEDLDGTVGNLTSSGANTATNRALWTDLQVTVSPDIADVNELFLGVGDEWVDPVFGGFKLVFASIESGGRETIEFRGGGSEGKIVFKNRDGQEVVLEVAADKNARDNEGGAEPVFWGDDAPSTSAVGTAELTATQVNQRLYFENEICAGPTSSEDVNNCKGAKFLVCTQNRHAHVMEITNIDAVSERMDFKDITYGVTESEKSFSGGTNGANINLGGEIGIIRLIVTNNSVKFVDLDTSDNTSGMKVNGSAAFSFSSAGPEGATGLHQDELNRVSVCEVETLQEGFIVINDRQGDQATGAATFGTQGGINSSVMEPVMFREGSDSDLPSTIRSFFALNASFDDSDDENIEWRILGNSSNPTYAGFGPLDESADNSDIRKIFTRKGTLITYDDEKQQFITIDHPHDRVFARVFVAPTASAVSQTVGSTLSQQKLQVDIDQIKLDKDVTSPTTKNIIAVGGPCANSVVAELLGNPEPCTNIGVEAGQALVKLVQNGDNVALIVAGYNAADSQVASRVVARYLENKELLTGTEVVLVTVNENQVTRMTAAGADASASDME